MPKQISIEEGKSEMAIKKCAEWLAFCLRAGWKKEDLAALEKIWWQWKRDRNGNLIYPMQGANTTNNPDKT